MSEKVNREIEVLVRARYPIIYILTPEEERVEQALIAIAKSIGKNAFSWSIHKGLRPAGVSIQSKKMIKESSNDPLIALDEIIERLDPAIYILKDFHPYMSDHAIVRKLREVAGFLKTSYKTMFIISPRLQIPSELEKDITVIDYPLPDYKILGALLDNIIEQLQNKPEIKINLDTITRERLIKSLQGLTLNEAENVIARAVILYSKFDASAIDVILAEKRQIIRRSGILEYYEYNENIDSVGGLELLKEWLMKRIIAFDEPAKKFGLPAPKGVMLIGIQGCGKSLCAKTISSFWKQPLLRLDMSKIFSSLIGSSEENMRLAIKTAESISPAIFWIDEIEKAFAGTQSSAFSDAGTTSRVFGNFITWLQEKESPVFVVATANDITNLPPELLRKGRFDEIFFVDLPSEKERREIFAIHFKKRSRDAKNYDTDLLAKNTEGFSGAEIEQVVISALYDAFYLHRDLTTEDVIKNIERTVPLSKTMAEKLDEMRNWSKGRTRPASLIGDKIE